MCTPICNLIAIEYPVFQAEMDRMREFETSRSIVV
jgi:hypothetical protein